MSLGLGLGLGRNTYSVFVMDQIDGGVGVYSTRKLRSSATTPIRVRNDAGVELDIGFIGEDLDEAALLAHCGAGNGRVATKRDQSGGNRDVSNITVSQMPLIVNAGVIDESVRYTQAVASNLSRAIAVDLGDEISISIVFKITANTGTIQALFTNGATATATGIKLFVNSFNTNDGKIFLEVANGVGTTSISSAIGKVMAGNWYHVVATMSKTNKRGEVFVNKVSEAVNLNIITNFDSNRNIFFGKFENNIFYPNAYIGDVMLFTKILNTAEIDQIYTDAKRIYPTLP